MIFYHNLSKWKPFVKILPRTDAPATPYEQVIRNFHSVCSIKERVNPFSPQLHTSFYTSWYDGLSLAKDTSVKLGLKVLTVCGDFYELTMSFR